MEHETTMEHEAKVEKMAQKQVLKFLKFAKTKQYADLKIRYTNFDVLSNGKPTGKLTIFARKR